MRGQEDAAAERVAGLGDGQAGRGGGQPAISPCALLPQRLIQPFVPQVRFVSTSRRGNACAATRARRVGCRSTVVGGIGPGYRRALSRDRREARAATGRRPGSDRQEARPSATGRPGSEDIRG